MSICGWICAPVLSYFVVRVQCRRKESSRSQSHLLMSFLSVYAAYIVAQLTTTTVYKGVQMQLRCNLCRSWTGCAETNQTADAPAIIRKTGRRTHAVSSDRWMNEPRSFGLLACWPSGAKPQLTQVIRLQSELGECIAVQVRQHSHRTGAGT